MATTGRPRALDDERKQHVLILVARGHSRDQVGKMMNVSPVTIRREARRDPRFAELLSVAEQNAHKTPTERFDLPAAIREMVRCVRQSIEEQQADQSA